MPRRIIRGPLGHTYSVAHADFVATYQGKGYVIVADEADRVPDVAPPFLNVTDPTGTWGVGTRYLIAHPDGRQYAVTYQQYVHRYQPLGFTIGRGERGEPVPG